MRDSVHTTSINVIKTVFFGRKKKFLVSWIKDNGMSYKCIELLEAIMSRKPVYAHEKPSRHMEDFLSRLRDLNQKMEAAALVTNQQERRLLSCLTPPQPEDLGTCRKGWMIMEGLIGDFTKAINMADQLRPESQNPLPKERHTLDEIMHMFGKYSLRSTDQTCLDFRKEFFHRSFTLIRISAWEDFFHDVQSLKDSTCFLLEIILKGSRLNLEESRNRFSSSLYKDLEEHIHYLENALENLVRPSGSRTHIEKTPHV